MSYQALARKWRPKSFTEVVGQHHVVKALTNALDQDRLHHAYLFVGTRGVGKTTLARVFAKCLNCEQGTRSDPCGTCGTCREIDEGRSIDLIEVDAASHTQVEDTRGLLDNVQYNPTSGKYKVYLIDEVHMLSKHSFNALLKTLEEPPPHVKFFLATTEPQRIPMTVLSRCLSFHLKRLPDEVITRQLEKITQAEDVVFEQIALRALADAAGGSMRDALSLLDQAIAHGDRNVTDTTVREMLGTVPKEYLHRLMLALADKDAAMVMQCTHELAQLSVDFEGLFGDIICILHQVALLQLVPGTRDDMNYDTEMIASLSKQLSPEDVQLFYQIALIGRCDLGLAASPHGALEMTLLRMLSFVPAGEGGATVRKASVKPVKPEKETGIQSEQAYQQTKVESLRGLNENKGLWSVVTAGLGLQGVSSFLASNCSVKNITHDTMVLNLAEQHEGVATEHAKRQLKEALQVYFGTDLSLIIDISSHEVETPAEEKERKVARQQSLAEQRVEEDQIVQACKSTFGAKVIQGSVRAIEE